jgi:hypothetical protein
MTNEDLLFNQTNFKAKKERAELKKVLAKIGYIMIEEK